MNRSFLNTLLSLSVICTVSSQLNAYQNYVNACAAGLMSNGIVFGVTHALLKSGELQGKSPIAITVLAAGLVSMPIIASALNKYCFKSAEYTNKSATQGASASCFITALVLCTTHTYEHLAGALLAGIAPSALGYSVAIKYDDPLITKE